MEISCLKSSVSKLKLHLLKMVCWNDYSTDFEGSLFCFQWQEWLWNSRQRVAWIKQCVKLRAWQAISSPSLQVQKTARNTANHQRHPSPSSCLCPSLSLVLSAIPHPLRIPTAPCGNEGHIAFWEKLSAKIPSGHGPTPTTTPTILPGLLQKFLGLQGTTQPKITGHISTFICIPEQAQTLQQQLFDHSQAQIEFWKVPRRYSWHTPFPLQWYERRRSQTWIRVPG